LSFDIPKLDWNDAVPSYCKAEDEISFKLYDASIIFLLDDIPSSYIYTEEFNNKLLSVLVLELLQACDQKTVHQDRWAILS
jgi:hypothetical protein